MLRVSGAASQRRDPLQFARWTPEVLFMKTPCARDTQMTHLHRIRA